MLFGNLSDSTESLLEPEVNFKIILLIIMSHNEGFKEQYVTEENISQICEGKTSLLRNTFSHNKKDINNV